MKITTPQLTQDTLLAEILPLARSRTFASGETIMSPDDDAQAFYYVQQGSVEVSYTDQQATRITVALIGEKEFFGEIGFFDGESRVRDIRANGEVTVTIFNAQTMNFLRQEIPGLYIDFLTFITQKICRKFRRIAGEREPVASYADLLSTRHSSTYTESKPIPASLLHSEGWHAATSRTSRFTAELFDLSLTLQQKDARGESDPASEKRCIELLGELSESLKDFQPIMAGSGYEEVMWGFLFKEVYPYLMRSRFAERAYFKPKGYAGDFLMMEHIYANEPKGDGRLGEIVDRFCLGRPGSLAIHGRRKLLRDRLAAISAENANGGRMTRIMNLACGPNRELFDFLAECPYSELIEALCVDIDPEALQYTNQHVNIFPHRASIRLMSENVIKWSLGRVTHQLGMLDVIYSAGLCDYLEPRLFKALIRRCHEHLNPGGTLMLGNFRHYPDSLFLDKLLKWELIYRDEDELRELFADTPFGDRVEIVIEEAQVNLFAIARKE